MKFRLLFLLGVAAISSAFAGPRGDFQVANSLKHSHLVRSAKLRKAKPPYKADPFIHVTNFSRLTPSLDCLRQGFNLLEGPGTWFRNTEDECWIAVNPANPDNMIIVTHQDRITYVDADGRFNFYFLADIVMYTLDGGVTWNESNLTLSRCQGPTLFDANDDFESASDPFVAFDNEGNAYVFEVAFNFDITTLDFKEANVVAKSTDGGRSWNHLTAVTRDDGFSNLLDKPSLATDPYRKDTIYTLWSDFLNFVGPNQNNITFSKSIDGGASWSNPISIIDFNFGTGGWDALLEVLPDRDHTLVVTVRATPDDNSATPTPIFALRSQDGGATWASYIVVNDSVVTNPVDPDLGIPVRAFGIGADLAQDKKKGYLYLVWQDPRYNSTGECGAVLSMSMDGGRCWTTPIPVNPKTLDVQTFLPTVAVADDGTVAVLFYDFRNFSSGNPSLNTDVWVSFFDKNLTHYLGEVRLTRESFDMRQAMRTGGCPFFVGDYCKIQSAGNDFVAAYCITNPPYGIGVSTICPIENGPMNLDFRNRQDVVFSRIVQKSSKCHKQRLGTFKTVSPKVVRNDGKKQFTMQSKSSQKTRVEKIRYLRQNR